MTDTAPTGSAPSGGSSESDHFVQLARLQFFPGADTPHVPLESLLIDAGLLGNRKDRQDASALTGPFKSWSKTPDTMQVIKAGALATTKWWSATVAAAGSVSGLAAVVIGAIRSSSDQLGPVVATALIASGALFAAASVIALAVFVGADLLARGTATSARHTGRADVISAYLAAVDRPAQVPAANESVTETRFVDQQLLLAYSAHPNSFYVVTRSGGEQAKVSGVRREGGEFKLQIPGEWIRLDEIDDYSTVGK